MSRYACVSTEERKHDTYYFVQPTLDEQKRAQYRRRHHTAEPGFVQGGDSTACIEGCCTACAVGAGVCVRFAGVMESVAPLEANATQFREESRVMEEKLKECQASLITPEEEQKVLRAQFSTKMAEKAQLNVRLEQLTAKLQSASTLLTQLSDEKSRWEAQIATMNSELARLPLQALLSAAFHVYLSKETEDKRVVAVRQWLIDFALLSQHYRQTENNRKAGTSLTPQIPSFLLHPNPLLYNYSAFMSSESERLEWKSFGLPPDDLSVENAVMIMSTIKAQQRLLSDAPQLDSNHYSKQSSEDEADENQVSPFPLPFIIDPTSTISQWLAASLHHQLSEDDTSSSQESSPASFHSDSSERQSKIDIIQQNDPKFLSRLELAISWGKTLLVQEVDQIEPVLFPFIRSEFPKQGNRLSVVIGDKTIEVNEKFQMFLFTRNPNPKLPPDAQGIVSQISFTITRAGLEGQLLSLTIQNELPHLEKQRSELLKKEEDLHLELNKLEEHMLDRLAKSKADILEDTELINSLKVTKEKSQSVNSALVESSKVQLEISKQRYAYRPFSSLGGTVYFLLRSLSALHVQLYV